MDNDNTNFEFPCNDERRENNIESIEHLDLNISEYWNDKPSKYLDN